MKKVMWVVVLFVMAAGVQAGLNTPSLVNPGFEDPVLDPGLNSIDINDWFDAVGYTWTQDEAVTGGTYPDDPTGENWVELGNGRWLYQQIGTYEENMDIDVTVQLGDRSDQPFGTDNLTITVELFAGGDAGLAADFNTKRDNAAFPLDSVVGATQIASSVITDPFADSAGTTPEAVEVTVSFSTGTAAAGYAVGDPLWLLISRPSEKGRALIGNVVVELPTSPVLVGPSNNELRADIDVDLQWNAPPIGVVDHYVLSYRDDPNFSEAGTTTVVDPATSPYDLGTLPYATQYYWRVDVVDDQAATITGKVWNFTTAPEVPQIDIQPVGVLVAGDGTASDQFTVAGLNIVNHAWQKNGVPLSNGGNIAGADTGTLTVSAVTPADEGLYSCIVDNDKGDFDETEDALLMTERLVAHFEFESDLTDTQGNLGAGVVVDPNTAAGNTEVADVGFGTGIVGDGCLDFGANMGVEGYQFGYVEVPGSEDDLRFNHLGLTVSAWVKCPVLEVFTSLNADFARVQYDDTDEIDPDNTNSAFVLNRYYGRATIINGGRTSRSPIPSETETDLRDDSWHMVTGVYDRSYDEVEEAWTGSTRVYIDGLLRNETSGLANDVDFDNLGVLRIGARRTTDLGLAQNPLVGQLDDLQIYSYPLGPVEIAEMYTSVTPEDDYVCIDSEGLELDFNGDCIVDLADFAQFAASWLNCRRVPDCL